MKCEEILLVHRNTAGTGTQIQTLIKNAFLFDIEHQNKRKTPLKYKQTGCSNALFYSFSRT